LKRFEAAAGDAAAAIALAPQNANAHFRHGCVFDFLCVVPAYFEFTGDSSHSLYAPLFCFSLTQSALLFAL
jgi:hypothetical protein